MRLPFLALCLLAVPAPAAASADYDVVERTIPELQAALEAGAVTSRGLVELYLARIEAFDRRGPRLQAMISLNSRALEEAAALDRERATRGPRAGRCTASRW